MADSNSVYMRVSDWNETIIIPINDLVTNPPDGCTPLTPLPEAEEDHLWMKQDIQDVHDKLEAMCPYINFDPLETPQLITVELISEIEQAIDVGWCNCEEQEPEEWMLGSFMYVRAEGTGLEDNCCGVEIDRRGPFTVFAGYEVYQYLSPYYDVSQYEASNTANMLVVQESYIEAREATIAWTVSRYDELLQQRIVEQKAEELQQKESELATLELQLAACTTNCASIQDQIDIVEQEISVLEGEIATAKSLRDSAKQTAIDSLATADAAAATNWDALSAIISWDPNAINIVNLIGSLSYEWGVGEFPFNYQRGSWGVTQSYWFTFGGPLVDPVINGFFTPSGLPFSYDGPLIWGSNWYKRWRVKHCCGIWDVNLGLCALGECLDWEEFESASDLPNNPSIIRLQLDISVTQGTAPAEDYDPNPDA